MGLQFPKTRGMLRREASSWLARLQSGRDPDVERKFERWRDADPRHADAFDRVRQTYDQAGLLRHSAIAASSQARPLPSRPEWTLRPALAAGAAVLVAVGIFSFSSGTNAMLLTTGVGEMRRVRLQDGSTVTLDTSTRVEVKIGRSRRGARVHYGRARFAIVQAAAPFVVETAGTIVTAGGGVVDIQQGAGEDRVQVLSGTADVRALRAGEAAAATLHAGDVMAVSANGSEQKSIATGGQDWTRGMLQFDNTPLAEAVALANRYSERHIILVGNPGATRVTGAFRAGDTAGLARALATAFGLSLQRDGGGNLVLSRGASPGLENKKGG